MSGGCFDYIQFRLDSVAEQIEQILKDSDEHGWSASTIRTVEEGLDFVRLARIFIHRIDYLVEGDDSEESFNRRLKSDLSRAGESFGTKSVESK